MKDPWFAVNLSMFFPGLGQIYAEKPIRGLILITIQSLFIGTGLWSIFNAEGDVLSGLIYLGFAISIYIFNLFDALLLIYYQSPEIYPERIPRKIKNTWFAVAISRVLPGLGHFYLNQSILGLILLTIALVSLRLQAFFWPLLVLTPLITAIASYHVFLSFSRTAKRSLIAIMASGIFVVGLFFNYLPQWINQQLAQFILPSQSMSPTLIIGDRIFVTKNQDYQPQRQDIIVFRPSENLKKLDPRPSIYYTKRIIGLPGEKIKIQDGIVYINDKPLTENYLAANPEYEFEISAIPPDQYFVLGDNRNDSFDSHIWGTLPRENIYGKAFKIYWPLKRVRSLLKIDL